MKCSKSTTFIHSFYIQTLSSEGIEQHIPSNHLLENYERYKTKWHNLMAKLYSVSNSLHRLSASSLFYLNTKPDQEQKWPSNCLTTRALYLNIMNLPMTFINSSVKQLVSGPTVHTLQCASFSSEHGRRHCSGNTGLMISSWFLHPELILHFKPQTWIFQERN